MHIGLITPDHQSAASGNQVLAKRLAAGLSRLGIQTTILTADTLAALDTGGYPFDLLHALHVRKAGAAVLAWAKERNVPFTVTCTGTDVDVDLDDPELRPLMGQVLAAASGIALLHAGMQPRLATWFPDCMDKTTAIPQGPLLPTTAGRPRKHWDMADDAFVFLQPGGLRAVKRPLFALEPLERLRQQHPQVQWVLAGPEIDPDIARTLQATAANRPWVYYLGEVSQAELVDLYKTADVVLNTSRAEGMPNTLLEAMSLGKPVLASAVDGNQALVEDKVNGLLFSDQESFYQGAQALLTDGALRRRLQAAARSKIEHDHNPEAEASAYLRLFQDALQRSRYLSCPQGGG